MTGRRHRSAARTRLVGAVLAVAVVSALGAPPALADNNPGLWYFDDYGVQRAHDSGITGKGVTVAIIDSPINPDIAGLADADLTVHEPGFCDVQDKPGTRGPATSNDPKVSGHGTQMALLIAGNGDSGVPGVQGTRGVAPEATIKFYATGSAVLGFGKEFDQSMVCYRDDQTGMTTAVAEAIQQAIKDKADIISISMSLSRDAKIREAVSDALQNNIVIVQGTSNNKNPTAGMSTLNGIVTVQSETPSGEIVPEFAKVDPAITVVSPGWDILSIKKEWAAYDLGAGNSMATAITSGFLTLAKSKYPDATGNQLSQSLIRNTGGTDHELLYDSQNYWGYGSVSLDRMLRADPTQYPNENPLFYKKDGILEFEEVYGPTSSPSSEAETSSKPPHVEDLFPVFYIWISLATLVLVCGGVALVLIMRRRKNVSMNDLSPQMKGKR